VEIHSSTFEVNTASSNNHLGGGSVVSNSDAVRRNFRDFSLQFPGHMELSLNGHCSFNFVRIAVKLGAE
jgi:hypothetical protein